MCIWNVEVPRGGAPACVRAGGMGSQAKLHLGKIAFKLRFKVEWKFPKRLRKERGSQRLSAGVRETEGVEVARNCSC